MHSTAHLVDKYRVPLRERGLFVPLSDKIYIIYRTTDQYIMATTPTRIHSLIDCAKLDAVVWHRSELFAAETSVKQRRSFVFQFHELHYIQSQRRFRWETVFTTLWVINSCRRHALLFYYHCSTLKCALWSLRFNFAVSFTSERYNRCTALKIIKEIYI